jgi:hypothetical protein
LNHGEIGRIGEAVEVEVVPVRSSLRERPQSVVVGEIVAVDGTIDVAITRTRRLRIEDGGQMLPSSL